MFYLKYLLYLFLNIPDWKVYLYVMKIYKYLFWISEPSTIVCSETRPCQPKEECVSVGTSPQCVCKRGYTRDPSSGKCRGMLFKMCDVSIE